VRRPRLIEQINAALQHKVTLISAPAGYGKTTLVSEWIADFRLPILSGQALDFRLDTPENLSIQNPKLVLEGSKIQNPIAWLSLDENDNDPLRFLTYLVVALQTLAPHLGHGVLTLLQSPQPPPLETILTALLNELATLPDPVVLILDDYHLIEDKAVDQALTFLIEHLPPSIHLVITTREDPQLPLARLRARGALNEVRAADLRFTPAEATAFLNQMMGLTLATEQITALGARTEGWIAGLQLAALSMRGREDIPGFIQAFTGDNRYIGDYLVEEVLQRQPAPVRAFLLQTAILDRLCGPLCDAVTQQTDGSGLLALLERANLFVVPLDDKREWYRYHHLFADVLQVRLLKEQPNLLPTLHQRASAWYDQQDLPADAIRHALAAKDFVGAAGLIERAWPAMDGRFQSATWLGWAQALPDELFGPRPVLSVAYGWALLNGGQLAAAEAHFRAAERWLAGASEQGAMIVVDTVQFQHLPASIATARAYQTQARGDILGSVHYGRQALDLLPEEDHLRRGPAAALLALAQWALGDLEEAYQTLAAAMTNFQKIGNLHFAISGTYGLGDIRTVQGRLHDAIQIYTQVLQLALAQGEPLLRGTAELYMGLGELAREQGDLDAASHYLLKGAELGEGAGLPDWRYRFCRIQARFKESQGDLAGALDLLAEAERHYRPTPVPDVRPLAAMKTRVWVTQGRLREAQRWVQEKGLSVDDDLSFLREFEQITLARVLLAEYRHEPADRTMREALHLLDRLQQAAEAGGRLGSVIEIAVLQALAHQAQDNLAPALHALARALTLAEPEGYVRLFVDEGAPMAELLSAAAARGIMPDYSSRLLAAFTADVAMPTTQSKIQSLSPPVQAWKDPKLVLEGSKMVEPLSERELDVLRLLATELNGPEIANRLMVSLNTLRTHTKNIFSKLGVNNRRAAVRRAEELGLL
jgi:LuxR family maltose regulon positive regulatory protein